MSVVHMSESCVSYVRHHMYDTLSLSLYIHMCRTYERRSCRSCRCRSYMYDTCVYIEIEIECRTYGVVLKYVGYVGSLISGLLKTDTICTTLYLYLYIYTCVVHMSESMLHGWVGHVSYIWVSHIAHMSESCRTWWVGHVSYIWVSHIQGSFAAICTTHDDMTHSYDMTHSFTWWVVHVSYIWVSHIAHISDFSHTCKQHLETHSALYEWVTSHIRISRMLHI